jgi:hypothetical protein
MSPSINTFWDVNGDPLTQAKKQAAILNCPNNTSRQIIECLMQKGAQEIASTYGDMLVSNFLSLFHASCCISLYYEYQHYNRSIEQKQPQYPIAGRSASPTQDTTYTTYIIISPELSTALQKEIREPIEPSITCT